MLLKDTISSSLFDFMKEQQNTVQEDPDAALRDFSQKMAEVIVDAIKSADITIQTGNIIVLTAAPGAPSANPAPIKLLKALS